MQIKENSTVYSVNWGKYHNLGSDLYPDRRSKTLKILNKHIRSNWQNENGGRGDRTSRGTDCGGDPGKDVGGRDRGMAYKIEVPVEKNMYISYKMLVSLPLPVKTAGIVVKSAIKSTLF